MTQSVVNLDTGEITCLAGLADFLVTPQVIGDDGTGFGTDTGVEFKDKTVYIDAAGEITVEDGLRTLPLALLDDVAVFPADGQGVFPTEVGGEAGRTELGGETDRVVAYLR